MAKPHAIQSGLGCSDAGARGWETNSSCSPHAKYIVLRMFFCDRLAVVFTCYQYREHQWPKIPWVFTAEVKSAKSAIAGRHQARFIENFLAHFMNGTITSLYASSPETQTFICLVGGGFFTSRSSGLETWLYWHARVSSGRTTPLLVDDSTRVTHTYIYIFILYPVYIYIHTQLHSYIHAYIHTYKHSYIHTYLFASFLPSVLPSFLPSLHTYLTLLNLT
jgi:hypothetical protein